MMVFIVFILFVLAAGYIFLVHKAQLLLERITKLICSLFFIVYILHRIDLQWSYYSMYPQRFTFFSWLNWGLVMSLFVFFLVSYLIREAPKVRANRWQEFVIPVICAFLPFVILESPRWAYLEVFQNIPLAEFILKPFYVQTPAYWNPFSILLIVIGGILTLLAMMSLKKSFSIFTEVRVPVYNGIYRYIRHPMYVGEVLSTVGLVCLAPNWIGILLTLFFIVLLWVRAKNEELKIASIHSDYKHYASKVSFPGLSNLLRRNDQ